MAFSFKKPLSSEAFPHLTVMYPLDGFLARIGIGIAPVPVIDKRSSLSLAIGLIRLPHDGHLEALRPA